MWLNTPALHSQVGVIMPSDGPTWATPAERQTVSLSGLRSLRTWEFKYMWPLGSASHHVFNVTVTISSPATAWMSRDPRVGKWAQHCPSCNLGFDYDFATSIQ